MTAEKSDAYLDGWLAHKDGLAVESNPYDRLLQVRSNHQWESGWCDRFGAIKHDRDLAYDDAMFE